MPETVETLLATSPACDDVFLTARDVASYVSTKLEVIVHAPYLLGPSP